MLVLAMLLAIINLLSRTNTISASNSQSGTRAFRVLQYVLYTRFLIFFMVNAFVMLLALYYQFSIIFVPIVIFAITMVLTRL